MSERLHIYLAALGLALSIGCASTVKEGIIWSSESERPQWTVVEPEADGRTMLFVGIAEKHGTEVEAREAAMKNVTHQVVRYMGTLAKDKYEKLSLSYGLSSSVVDPTASVRNYEKQVAVNVTKNVKPKKWYLEKWKTPSGTAWKVFVMATVPLETINDSFKSTARENMLEAQRQATESADDYAKRQAENAAKFWEDMSKQSVLSE